MRRGLRLSRPGGLYKQWVEQEKATKAPAMELPQLKEAVNSGLMYELFGKYNPNPQEPAIPRSCWRRPPAQTDTALWVLGPALPAARSATAIWRTTSPSPQRRRRCWRPCAPTLRRWPWC